MKKPWSVPYLVRFPMTRHFFAARKFFAILIAMAVFLFSQNEAFAAAPAYRASGTFTAGTAAITVPYPAGMLANDVCLLAVESENQNIALTTANGFVQVPTSPQSAGTAAVNPASRLALFWKRTVGGDAAPVVTDSGDHTTGRIHCFSGVITSGNPWDAGAGGNDGGANDTTGTIPGATTTSPDTLVVLITSNSRNGTSTANCSAWTNASLTSLTERSDNTNTAGLGGGHCMATGVKAAAGPYAATTVTLATTSFKGAISLALKPATAGPTATTNAASGITSWVATLNGTVSSNGMATTVSFDYGLTAAYGYSIAATPSPLAFDAVNTAVSADLIGLNCNTLFHYRVKATNSAGTTNGLDGTFTTGACGAPYPETDCAATRFGSDLVCAANDVNLTGIVLAPTNPVQQSSCVSGTPVTLDIDMTVNFATPDRWDVGIFIANDGKLPTLLPANGGASSCSVDILPTSANIIPPPVRDPVIPFYGDLFLDLDGAPQGTTDKCGDGNSAINGGTGSGVKRMYGVTLPCNASPDSGGKLFVPFVVSWDNQKSPIGGLCTSNLDPVPNTTSKCNAPLSSVAIEVVVLPKIIKTHSGATFNPPSAPITYTITVFNDSGGALQQSTLKDIHDIGLALDSIVTCATANGSTCPAASKELIEGSGIVIPSANLPDNSSLIFTVTGTLSGSIGQTISNTATVSIGLNTNSSTDSVTLGSASASKSFAPATITEGNNSLMTITFTNPTAFDVTGVSFTDTYPAGLANTAAANGVTTCPSGAVTAVNYGNSLALSNGTIPAFGSCTVSVYVTSDTANNYINSVSFLPDSLGSASATLTVNVAVFGAFNACDVGTSCTNTTTPTTSHIMTKIAGSAFSLDLVALKTNGTRNTNYNSNVFVELLDASDNSGALDAYNCRSSWTAVIATLNGQFTPGDNGLITVGLFTVANAYRDVRVRVTNVGGATKKGCSTDRFAIRPNSFTVVPSDDNWTTAGILRTINNTDATSPGSSTGSPPIHKAGQPFKITATAKNASNVTTTNYNVTVAPTAALSDCSPGTACTASFGTLALGTPTFSAGAVTWNSATYSEVGSFNLTLQDTDFASVDAADTAASCAGYYVCSAPTAVGRFVPDHFDTAVIYDSGTKVFMPCPSGLACPSSGDLYYPWSSADAAWSYADAVARTAAAGFVASDVGKIARQLDDSSFWELTAITPTWSLAIFGKGFVYSGQPFRVQVTAKNAGGNTTQNYQGVFAKAVTLAAWDALGSTTTQNPSGLLTNNSIAAALFGAVTPGVATTSTPVYTLTAATTAPTDIYVRAEDTDGVTSLRTTNPTTTSVEGGVKVASGRVKIANAYGSELLPLTLPATVQYYNAAGSWVTSNSDTVTAINPSDFALAFPVATLVACETSVSITGSSPSFTVNLSRPGTGNNGWTGLTLNLGATPAGNQCVGGVEAASTSANRPWLQFPTGANPTARATFGVYKGNNQFIYLREMY